ncbi:MAG: TRAP transporter substrate-binding protein [Firmicutes bacterium]|nr:TRAP transporter substrate-binding protein [Bacillota bacterium]
MVKSVKARVVALVVAGVLVVSLLAGCSGSQPAAPAPGGQPKAEQPKQEVFKVKFGHNQDTNSPQHRCAEAFKQKVEELSKGRVQVTVYPNMQLGQLRQQAEQVQAGTQEMSMQPVSVWGNFAQALEGFDIPFLFANNDAMFEVVTGPVGQEVFKALEAKGLVQIGVETGGLKVMTGKAPYRGPKDLKGKKFRVMPAPILIETYKAFGANPTPVEYGELYNALQQGVVDGQENPLQTLSMLKLWEVQKAVTITNNGPMLYVTVGNKKWFDSLPKDLQQNIRDAMAYADKIEWEDLKKNEEGYLKQLKEKGMEVYSPTPEEMQAFREASKPVVEFIAGRIGKDLVDKLMKTAEAANIKYSK